MKTSQKIIVTLMCAAAPVAFAATAQENWTAHCAKCHGADGAGQTAMGKKLKLVNYTTAEGQAAFTDAQATESIANGAVEDGKTKKKGFKDKLTAEEISDLVKHVRAFGPK
ncbi:MAG TPA: cytochrome c [Opitutaceae bacterium]|nr:cytochrome c [Opitutaceae bacterium]